MGLKTPKLSRVPQCGRPTGLDMGGIHRWDQNQAKTWLKVIFEYCTEKAIGWFEKFDFVFKISL